MLTMAEIRKATGLSYNTVKDRVEKNGISAFALKTKTNTIKYLYDVTIDEIKRGALERRSWNDVERRIKSALTRVEKAMDSITYARLKGA